jgi:hypothetical protein
VRLTRKPGQKKMDTILAPSELLVDPVKDYPEGYARLARIALLQTGHETIGAYRGPPYLWLPVDPKTPLVFSLLGLTPHPPFKPSFATLTSQICPTTPLLYTLTQMHRQVMAAWLMKP